MKKFQAGALVALVAMLACAGPAAAVNVTGSVQKQCQWDYHNYCSDYGIGSSLLSMCFKKNGAKLSKGCVAALEQAGDVSVAYVKGRKKAGH